MDPTVRTHPIKFPPEIAPTPLFRIKHIRKRPIMPPIQNNTSRPKQAATKTHPHKKSPGCLILCNEFVHDFSCPSVKRVYPLHEIEQNFNILRTALGSVCDPGQYRRPPGTPIGTSTPNATKAEIKLDFGLLHEAIVRSCDTEVHRGFDQSSVNEEAAAALILMGMDGGPGPAYKPTSTDVLYHGLSCRNELTPGASKEEIQEDMNLFCEAIADQEDASWLLRLGETAARYGESVVDALDSRKRQQQFSGWMMNGSRSNLWGAI